MYTVYVNGLLAEINMNVICKLSITSDFQSFAFQIKLITTVSYFILKLL